MNRTRLHRLVTAVKGDDFSADTIRGLLRALQLLEEYMDAEEAAKRRATEQDAIAALPLIQAAQSEEGTT